MKYKLIMIVVLVAAITLSGVATVSAKPSFMSAFNQYYGTDDTRLDSCAICHAGPNGGSINSYGRAYSESGRNFASIDERDSDNDGFTNLEEIQALTFPGNSNEYPIIPEVIPETIINETDMLANESIDEQDTEEQNNNEIPEANGEMINETPSKQQSPGFEVIIGIAGILSVVYLKRRR